MPHRTAGPAAEAGDLRQEQQPCTIDISRARILTGLGSALGKMFGRLAGVPVLLLPSSQVHTWFCPSPLDVVYLDRGGTVLAVETLLPWRLGRRVPGCRAVLELDAGEAEAWGIRPGVRCVHRGWNPC